MAQEAVELSKAVISSKNTEHRKKLSSKPFMPVEQQVEIDRNGMRKALKKITNAIKKTRNYTERDKR
jgi:hypothetical protein